MFRRFISSFTFVNERGETQTIPAGWAGEVSSSVSKAAEEAGALEKLDKDGKPIPVTGVSAEATVNASPVSEAKVAPPPAPAPAQLTPQPAKEAATKEGPAKKS